MRTLKTLLTVAATVVSIGAFADAANTLITFSTPGQDMYADGSTVLDGERYALVWSQDGEFNGFNVDGTPVDKNDKVIFIASLAKDHRCPPTIFQIDSKVAPDGGVYEVYLLDTRASTGSNLKIVGAVAAKTYDTKVEAGNIKTTATDDNTVDENGVVQTLKASATGGKVALDQTVAPKIDSIKVEGATVTIAVSNLVPGLKYTVVGGLDRKTTVEDIGFKNSTSGNIVIENKNEQFFSIKAE